jgi:hypothetical protein
MVLQGMESGYRNGRETMTDKSRCPDKHPWDNLTKQELFLLAKYHEARADQLEKIVMTAVCGEPSVDYRIQVPTHTGEDRPDAKG